MTRGSLSPRSSQPASRVGIFLYDDNTDYVPRILGALQGFNALPYLNNIRAVNATPDIISNLIPDTLKDRASSWLVIYRTDYQDQLLILPFPTEEELRFINNVNSIRNYLTGLLEIITASRQDSWYPLDGFRNLIENLVRSRASRQEFIPERFQIVRVSQSLDMVLSKPILLENPVLIPQNRNIKQEVSVLAMQVNRGIQDHREASLALLLGSDESKENIFQQFDNILIEESERLAKHIVAKFRATKVVPDIVIELGPWLDDITKKFLISSETVHHFTIDNIPHDFDFSLAGCGLWKTIEREMNLSFIWHLRRINGLTGNDPLIPLISTGKTVTYKAGNENVPLNEKEKDTGNFRGIELGKLEYLLRSSRENGIYQELEKAINISEDLHLWRFVSQPKSLPSFLGRIRLLRNEYAHIKAMPVSQYRELRSLVLMEDVNLPGGLLRQVIELKKAIISYWADKS